MCVLLTVFQGTLKFKADPPLQENSVLDIDMEDHTDLDRETPTAEESKQPADPPADPPIPEDPLLDIDMEDPTEEQPEKPTAEKSMELIPEEVIPNYEVPSQHRPTIQAQQRYPTDSSSKKPQKQLKHTLKLHSGIVKDPCVMTQEDLTEEQRQIIVQHRFSLKLAHAFDPYRDNQPKFKPAQESHGNVSLLKIFSNMHGGTPTPFAVQSTGVSSPEVECTAVLPGPKSRDEDKQPCLKIVHEWNCNKKRLPPFEGDGELNNCTPGTEQIATSGFFKFMNTYNDNLDYLTTEDKEKDLRLGWAVAPEINSQRFCPTPPACSPCLLPLPTPPARLLTACA